MAVKQPTLIKFASWPKKFGASRAKNPTQPRQAARSARKCALREQRRQTDQSEATRLGITVDQLRQRKFDEVKHLFRDSAEAKARAAIIPETYIRGYRDEAYCPHCDRINSNCITGKNTCQRCGQIFLGKH